MKVEREGAIICDGTENSQPHVVEVNGMRGPIIAEISIPPDAFAPGIRDGSRLGDATARPAIRRISKESRFLLFHDEKDSQVDVERGALSCVRKNHPRHPHLNSRVTTTSSEPYSEPRVTSRIFSHPVYRNTYFSHSLTFSVFHIIPLTCTCIFF